MRYLFFIVLLLVACSDNPVNYEDAHNSIADQIRVVDFYINNCTDRWVCAVIRLQSNVDSILYEPTLTLRVLYSSGNRADIILDKNSVYDDYGLIGYGDSIGYCTPTVFQTMIGIVDETISAELVNCNYKYGVHFDTTDCQ